MTWADGMRIGQVHTNPKRKRGGEDVVYNRDISLTSTSSRPRLRFGLV